MQTIEVKGQTGRSSIMIGERLANLKNYLPPGHTVIITDEIVGGLFQEQFPAGDVITMGCGEKNKTLETLAAIYDQLVRLEADRSTFIVGIGGGIVGDVSGFAASTYMRGLRFGFAATSLLAQVDASVGGKNGVNFKGYKNMVGVFNQPEFVLADIALLKTLPPEEVACGLAEIVKHGCIADNKYFECIEENCEAIKVLDHEVMLQLIHGSVAIKAAVVNRDEREAGERRKLNFGHNFGHAFEKTLGFSHGRAVSIGMALAAELSYEKGFLTAEIVDRIKRLLTRLGLPIAADYDAPAVYNALKRDKKRSQDQIHFVLLDGIGRARIEAFPIEWLEQWLQSKSK
jgi:3-dehydroquinate synthase